MWPRHILQDEAGEGGEGGGGGTSSPPDVSKLMEQVGMLTQSVSLLANGMQEMQTALKDIPNHLQQRRDPDPDPTPAGKGGDLFAGQDLEQLSRADFASLILSKFIQQLEGNLDAKLKPLAERIDTVQSTVTSDIGNRQLHDVKSDNPDVMEWSQELTATLKQNPNLSLRQALAVVRSENPEKVQKLQSKYKKDDGKDGPAFLGMTPTSTSGAPRSSGKVSFNEAANAAMDSVVRALGGESFEHLSVVGRR